jgi:tetratricopeptide (TPR) repeat protein
MMWSRDAICIVAVCAAAIDVVPRAVYCETLEDGLAALKSGYDTMALPKLEEAVRILRAQTAGPDPIGEAHYHLARALEGMAIYHVNAGKIDDAMGYLQQGVVEAKVAVERNPSSSAFHTILGSLYGELAGQSGVVGKMRYGRLSVASYNRALELDPRNALAHVGAGIGKLETPAMFGGSAVEALEEFRKAQKLDPTCDEAWIWEGVTLRRQGSVEEARQAFTKALAVNPNSDHAHREMASLKEDF